mmetsp:Transcript_31455/g.79157  ORF Transcript_31455/g.79157 Transcript_31455/m.79157 type:complete len:241 (+) Transcript_31455:5147-5869(+)
MLTLRRRRARLSRGATGTAQAAKAHRRVAIPSLARMSGSGPLASQALPCQGDSGATGESGSGALPRNLARQQANAPTGGQEEGFALCPEKRMRVGMHKIAGICPPTKVMITKGTSRLLKAECALSERARSVLLCASRSISAATRRIQGHAGSNAQRLRQSATHTARCAATRTRSGTFELVWTSLFVSPSVRCAWRKRLRFAPANGHPRKRRHCTGWSETLIPSTAGTLRLSRSPTIRTLC